MTKIETCRWFKADTKMRLVEWEDIKAGECFYYSIKKHRSTKMAHGPFRMSDPKNRIISNSQGFEIKFNQDGDVIQLLVPVELSESIK